MIIDSHYHLETRIQPIEELIASMDKHGISQTALIPTMVEPFPMSPTATKLGDLLRKALVNGPRGIARFVYRTTVDSKGNFMLLGKKFRIYQRPDNSEVARAVEKYPERFVQWVFVNPAVEDAVKEAKVWMDRPGAIGVKAHPFWHRYSVALLDPMADFCASKGWPLLVHLGGDKRSGDYRYLPDRHPKLKIVYAHAGVPFFTELWDYVKTKENVFVDISSPYLDESVAKKAVAALGADNCLYGTDGPYGFHDANGRFDHSEVLGWINRLDISDADREKILSGNFLAIARK